MLTLVAVLAVIHVASAAFSQNCLVCIGKTESGCYNCQGDDRKCVSCRIDVGTYSCGMYQIKDPYYTDCYQPGNSWYECTTGSSSGTCASSTAGQACSEECVNAYMNRYGNYCVPGTTEPVCEDYARIHNGGPTGCTNSATDDYWARVQECCRINYGGNC